MKKMMKVFLCSALLLSTAILSAQSFEPNRESLNSAPSGQINWMRTYSEAVALSQSTSKPIVILFTGTGWCPACMKLERDVLSRTQFAQDVGNKFVFLKAEFPEYSESSVMASPYKPLLDRYSIDSFPTFVVINANGQKISTVNYRNGNPAAYAQELLQTLNQQNAGYYR